MFQNGCKSQAIASVDLRRLCQVSIQCSWIPAVWQLSFLVCVQEALDSMTHGTGPIDLTNGDVGMAPGVQLTSAAGAGSKETTLAEQVTLTGLSTLVCVLKVQLPQVAQPSDCHLKWNLGQFKQLPPAIVYVYRVQCFRWHVLLVLTLNLTDAAHIAIVHVTAPCAHPECVLQGSLAVRRSKRKRSEISSPDVQVCRYNQQALVY